MKNILITLIASATLGLVSLNALSKPITMSINTGSTLSNKVIVKIHGTSNSAHIAPGDRNKKITFSPSNNIELEFLYKTTDGAYKACYTQKDNNYINNFSIWILYCNGSKQQINGL